VPRSSFVLSSKVGRLLVPTETPHPMQNFPEALGVDMIYDTSAEGIRRSLSESVARLGGIWPDILLLHDPDRYAEGDELRRLIESAHRALSDLKREGRVRAIGIGVNSPAPCHVALAIGDWDCFLLAGCYSVLRQEDDGILEACRARAISVLIGAPFMSGALAGGSTWRYRPIPAAVATDIDKLRAAAVRHDVPVEALALQYPLRHPAVASVVVGMRSPQEVEQNVRALTASVPDALWDELRDLGLIDRPSRHSVQP
jgi:D-threo-aldose 1-dehydrogenase